MNLVLLVVVGCCVLPVQLVWAHGRMVDPPARNTMWRYGFENPRNYDDDELFCGGITKQWDVNGGKCGVCGDDYSASTPRKHEMGGYYGNGIVVRTYSPGQVITVTIYLSTNHKGYYEFRLCPYQNPKKEVTEKCLEELILPFTDTYETRYHIPPNSPAHDFRADFKLKLPERLTCKNCLLQWHWYTGNFWGNCPNGTAGLGCGNQETYRNCADVSIGYFNVPAHAHMRPLYSPSVSDALLYYFYGLKRPYYNDKSV